MKKIIFIAFINLLIAFNFPFAFVALAQDNHTAREEAEGRTLWEKLQAKQTSCPNLSEDDFGALGEYFMGQMLGSSHETMNTMMEQMMGKASEEQMHVVMGKRFSGCDSSAAFPSQSVGLMPMMNMMMGGWSSPSSFNPMNNMMGNFGTGTMGWFGLGFGWILMILWWLLIIAAIVALIKWLFNQGRGRTEEKSAFDILKKRYARGEIDRQEFEEKKKDLM